MSHNSLLEDKWPIFPFLEYIILMENQLTFDKEWKSYLSHVDFFPHVFFQWVNEWWDVCASKCIKKYNHSREIPRTQNAWEILLLQVIEMQQLLHAGHLWRFLEPVEDLSKYNTFLVKILSIVNALLLRIESFHGAMTNLEFRWETYSIISSPEKRNLEDIHRPC